MAVHSAALIEHYSGPSMTMDLTAYVFLLPTASIGLL